MNQTPFGNSSSFVFSFPDHKACPAFCISLVIYDIRRGSGDDLTFYLSTTRPECSYSALKQRKVRHMLMCHTLRE